MHVLWQAAQGSRTWQVSTRVSIGLKKTEIRKLMAWKELFAGGHSIMYVCKVDGQRTVGAIGVRGFSTSRMGKRLQRAGRLPSEGDERERKRST